MMLWQKPQFISQRRREICGILAPRSAWRIIRPRPEEKWTIEDVRACQHCLCFCLVVIPRVAVTRLVATILACPVWGCKAIWLHVLPKSWVFFYVLNLSNMIQFCFHAFSNQISHPDYFWGILLIPKSSWRVTWSTPRHKNIWTRQLTLDPTHDLRDHAMCFIALDMHEYQRAKQSVLVS